MLAKAHTKLNSLTLTEKSTAELRNIQISHSGYEETLGIQLLIHKETAVLFFLTISGVSGSTSFQNTTGYAETVLDVNIQERVSQKQEVRGVVSRTVALLFTSYDTPNQ